MKRQNDSDESDDEIFAYSNKEKLTFSYKPLSKKSNIMDSSSDESESDEESESSSSSSEDEVVVEKRLRFVKLLPGSDMLALAQPAYIQ